MGLNNGRAQEGEMLDRRVKADKGKTIGGTMVKSTEKDPRAWLGREDKVLLTMALEDSHNGGANRHLDQ